MFLALCAGCGEDESPADPTPAPVATPDTSAPGPAEAPGAHHDGVHGDDDDHGPSHGYNSTLPVRENPEAVAHVHGRLDQMVRSIDGQLVSLHDYRGRVLLVVNTASRCVFTPQYAELQTLFAAYRDQGLSVLAFPSDEFGGQEPGDADAISDFVETTFAITFDLFDKIDVNGSKRAEPYVTLCEESPEPLQGDIAWNFTKFLVDGDGFVADRFESAVSPLDARLVQRVEEELARLP
jgi:glutathione peroxidase